MDPQTENEILRKSRQGHGAIMLVGLLMTVLLAGVAFVALGSGPVVKALAPTESSTQADTPTAE